MTGGESTAASQLRDKLSRSAGSVPTQGAFRGERQKKTEERMKNSLYKDLPPLGRRPDGFLYLYYPICEVVGLLHCGRQKAVNTLRELQYAELIDIKKKQGCGKPNCIYPKSYEAVSNADFKKSGFGTPEG
ncbi:MAG: hypothetical protein ACLU3D_07110 [Acutalibacteraceae bacterium]